MEPGISRGAPRKSSLSRSNRRHSSVNFRPRSSLGSCTLVGSWTSPSPGQPRRTCRIPHYGGRVQVIEQRKITWSLCKVPIEPQPTNDLILLHKLLIEADEASYLATANHSQRYLYRGKATVYQQGLTRTRTLRFRAPYYTVASYSWRMALRSCVGSQIEEAATYHTSARHGITERRKGGACAPFSCARDVSLRGQP